MKRITILVIALTVAAITLKAQGSCCQQDSSGMLKNDKTLCKGGVTPKFFIAPVLELSKQADLAGISGGAGLGFIFSDFFAGAYYLENMSSEGTDEGYNQSFRHGGLLAGYLLNPEKLIHFQGGLKIGYGSLVKNYPVTDNISSYSGNLFIVNPNIGAEINITPYMRFGINGGYRIVEPVGINAENIFDVKDYQGLAFEAVLKIGSF